MMIPFLYAFRVEPTQIDAVVGTTKWDKGGDHYNVIKAVVHNKYVSEAYSYDIALLKLGKPIKFNKNVQPIKYSAKVVPENKPLKVR